MKSIRYRIARSTTLVLAPLLSLAVFSATLDAADAKQSKTSAPLEIPNPPGVTLEPSGAPAIRDTVGTIRNVRKLPNQKDLLFSVDGFKSRSCSQDSFILRADHPSFSEAKFLLEAAVLSRSFAQIKYKECQKAGESNEVQELGVRS